MRFEKQVRVALFANRLSSYYKFGPEVIEFETYVT